MGQSLFIAIIYTDHLFADSARRSGRATKGQHKKLEVDDQESPVPKKAGRGKKKEETPPTEIIRCICGITNEEEDEESRNMICCDSCSAWEHNDCMEIPAELPDGEQYFCEQCRPDLHEELLAKIARGEKPWEERARLREEEKVKGRKGRGRKGKKGRPSVVKINGAANDGDASHVDETPEEAQEVETPVTETNKRKLVESAEDAKTANQTVCNRQEYSLDSELMIDNRSHPARHVRSLVPFPQR